MQAKKPRILLQRAADTVPDRTRLAGITYFTGVEVERTAAHNMVTLFVVGRQETTAILTQAKRAKHKGRAVTAVTHVYLGALGSLSQSLAVFTEVQAVAYLQDQITTLRTAGYMVTLDTRLEFAEHLRSWPVFADRGVILLLSVPLPNIRKFGRNVALKFDDCEFGGDNGGVYVLHLRDDIVDRPELFTPWGAYTEDCPC